MSSSGYWKLVVNIKPAVTQAPEPSQLNSTPSLENWWSKEFSNASYGTAGTTSWNLNLKFVLVNFLLWSFAFLMICLNQLSCQPTNFLEFFFLIARWHLYTFMRYNVMLWFMNILSSDQHIITLKFYYCLMSTFKNSSILR